MTLIKSLRLTATFAVTLLTCSSALLSSGAGNLYRDKPQTTDAKL